MKQSEIEAAIFNAKQELASARANEQTSRDAFLAAVVITQSKQDALAAALALVADDTPPPEPIPEEPPPARFSVNIEPDVTAVFTRAGLRMERAGDGTLEAGVYSVSLGREDGAGHQSASAEFTLAAATELRLNGGQVQVVIDP